MAIWAPKMPIAIFVASLLFLGLILLNLTFLAPDSENLSTGPGDVSSSVSTTLEDPNQPVEVPPGYKRVELKDSILQAGTGEISGWICFPKRFPYDDDVTCFVPESLMTPTGASARNAPEGSPASSSSSADSAAQQTDTFTRLIAIGTLLTAVVTALGAVGVRVSRADASQAPNHV